MGRLTPTAAGQTPCSIRGVVLCRLGQAESWIRGSLRWEAPVTVGLSHRCAWIEAVAGVGTGFALGRSLPPPRRRAEERV